MRAIWRIWLRSATTRVSFLSRGYRATRCLTRQLMAEHRPQAVVNFAAESHVDRSIDDPLAFVSTNVAGTCRLLEASLDYFRGLPADPQSSFRFLQISTDEVFGALGSRGPVHPQFALCPEFPVCRFEGGRRPFRTGLSPNLRAAHADHALRQQLRSLPVSGKADPLDHSPRRRRPDAASLRKRGQRPRLDSRGGSLCRSAAGPGTRDDLGSGTCLAATANDPISRSSEPSAASSTGLCPARTRLPRIADHLGRRSAWTRFPLCHRCHRDAQQLGWQPSQDLDTGLEETVRWYLEHTEWVERVRAAAYDERRIGLRGLVNGE